MNLIKKSTVFDQNIKSENYESYKIYFPAGALRAPAGKYACFMKKYYTKNSLKRKININFFSSFFDVLTYGEERGGRGGTLVRKNPNF